MGDIKRLDPDVVAQIAAGEVVQAPSNALKELIENCLDAKAKSISVQVKAGGFKLLQISDNGHGIKRADLDIVCERFTTSKLQKFEDLQNICTYGFRGEALASISRVAHVTITSKTQDQPCAYKAKYKDGKLEPFTPGGNPAPKPTAGVVGTQITIEDMFYKDCLLTRKRALSNTQSEEYNKILRVVTRYALHNHTVAFSCKKFGESSTDVQTSGGSAVDTFKTLFGNTLAREILEFSVESTQYEFKAKGFISNPNYNRKKGMFIFFINNRLVDCSPLKKGLEETYSTFLPKQTHPFVYLSIEIVPQNIDVNIHPTKNEVRMLNETEIIEVIQKEVDSKLLSCNSSRTFYVQTPGDAGSVNVTTAPPPAGSSSSTPAKSLVRTESRVQPLTMYFDRNEDQNDQPAGAVVLDELETDPINPVNSVVDSSSPSTKKSSTNLSKRARVVSEVEDITTQIDDTQTKKQARTKQTPILLTSIRNLIEKVESQAHQGLTELFHNYTFVGCANSNFALVQFRTKLYLMRVDELSKELFYQVCLRKFSNFSTIRLSSPASVSQLIELALECESSGWTEEDGDKSEIAKYNSDRLIAYAEMLLEYFSISISPEGNLLALPQLIPKYIPPLENLPMFLLNLCVNVDWSDEQPCLGGIARQLAEFYALPIISSEEELENPSFLDPKNTNSRPWILENMIFPALRSDFTPLKSFSSDGTIVQVACLEKLYKVFERC